MTTAEENQNGEPMNLPDIVSRDEWRAARTELLAKEKDLTRQRDALNAERRRLPMVEIDEDYIFKGPDGEASLLDLFEGRRQLVVYHFMFDPEWDEGCKVCSFLADNIGHLSHLHSLDTSLVMVSHAPYDKLEQYRSRMGWSVPWYSSYGSDFNYDFHVTIDASRGSVEHNYRDVTDLARNGSTEAHGTSVFLRDGDDIYHTYSSYERGNGLLVGTFNYLDLTPLGRHEHREEPAGHRDGTSGNWLRRHDEYDE
jgi:predicted dithiol-disulfide oxidoreductase (DUF899 family)